MEEHEKQDAEREAVAQGPLLDAVCRKSTSCSLRSGRLVAAGPGRGGNVGFMGTVFFWVMKMSWN